MRFDKWEFPDNLLYDEHYQWIRPLPGKIAFGLTPYGLEVTGDVLYLSLPPLATAVKQNSDCGSLEAGKWVGRIYSPVSGKVAAINSEVAKFPAVINKAPFASWFCEIALAEPRELGNLMNLSELILWLTEDMKRNA
jgi:glycine cleavage system H protein